ncbi:MAG: type II secretion system protein GspD [Deltaproteobacteria bacterium GWB2_55_19]|nr:MAG: type II secretion system protein GspD [Deltaproteobacteria bacterium GWB2_55_19]HAO92741.1 type II secretion system protein GspD [Deltaproteobacteria bacterium]
MRPVGKPSIAKLLTIALILPALVFLTLSSAEARAKEATHKTDKVLINFVDVDLPTVANFISKLTGRNFIFDEGLSGKVTIVAPSKLDPDEAYDLFVSVLKLKGYTIINTGRAMKIVPSAEIRQGPVEVYDPARAARVNESYIARLVPLAHVQAQDILPVLQPLVSKEGYISAFGKGNSLLVVDNALNIEKILSIARLADTETKRNAPEVIYLKNAHSETISQSLAQYRTGAKAKKDSAQTEASVIADKRLNAIILFGTTEENEENRRLIAVLDVPSPEVNSRINVYYLENADSTSVAKVLEGLIKQQSPAQPGTETKIAVTPDKDTNSVIIMATPEDYQNLVQVIKKLDRRPKQVFVEAMITEVSINKSLELGTKWRASGTSSGNPVVIGGVGTIDSSSLTDIVSGMAGFSIGGVANFLSVPVTQSDGTVTELSIPGFAALFSLSEFKDAIEVLSTPHILTSDNKEAEIIVGENVPFLSKLERDSSSTSGDLLQSIERKDIGITLRIKPQISEGDYIRLDIYQEISALSSTAQEASDIITTKRSAKTSVVVKDRQTVVIGGLIQDRKTKNTSKMPFLGDIPIIGWLFKSDDSEKEKINLLVYITPRIIKDLDDLDAVTKAKRDEFGASSKDPDEKEEKGEKEEAPVN